MHQPTHLLQTGRLLSHVCLMSDERLVRELRYAVQICDRNPVHIAIGLRLAFCSVAWPLPLPARATGPRGC